jgi:clan AA aspartic protease
VITGIVTADREAIINWIVYGDAGRKRTIEAVIDTGYDGWLTLPPAMISQLCLPWDRQGRGWLADGSEIVFDIYEGRVEWDGEDVSIPVDEADPWPLVGMALMDGFAFNMQVRTGGEVQITRLS